MKTEQEPDLRLKPTVHDQCGSKNINDTGSANRSKRVNQDEAQRKRFAVGSAAGGFFARNIWSESPQIRKRTAWVGNWQGSFLSCQIGNVLSPSETVSY